MFWRRKNAPDRAGGGREKPPRDPSPAADAPASASGDSDDTGTRFLTGDSDVDRRTIEVLLSTIARVSASRDLEATLVEIVKESVKITRAERGFLILVDGSGEPRVRVARTADGVSIVDDARFSTSVVRLVLETQQPKLATVQSDSDALELGRSVFDLKIRAVMCVPLTTREDAKNGTRGVLYVDSRAATREFDHRDLGLFAALSHHISIALENARLLVAEVEKSHLEHSLELASAIQSGLMPPIPRDVPGLEVHGWYRPAERTSGDFFDFVRMRDGRLAIAVGDVSGHGIGPALITAAAQASLRSYLRTVPDPAAALGMLNQDLIERMEPGMFVTLLVLAFGDDGKLEALNAGHHAAIIARAGEVLSTRGSGTALGMFAESSYESGGAIDLEPGDVVVAFTDGLIEAHPPGEREQLFGEERLRALVLEHARQGASAEAITRALAEAAYSFARGSHEDDITLVVVRKT
jgi:serine phosphatase RsbU (regulator of sigma subunit)